MSALVSYGESVITRVNEPFMVDNEIVLWADALSEDDIVDENGNRYKSIYFISCSVEISFSCDDGLHLLDVSRIDEARPLPRGLVTSILKTCIQVAAKHIDVCSVSLRAAGMLLSDKTLKKHMLESMRIEEVHGILFQRLAAYFERLGFRRCNDEVDPLMVMMIDRPCVRHKRSFEDELMEEADSKRKRLDEDDLMEEARKRIANGDRCIGREHVQHAARMFFAFSRVGDDELATVGHAQQAAIAGLPATQRIEHRAVEDDAAFANGNHARPALSERGVFAEQLFGHHCAKTLAKTLRSTLPPHSVTPTVLPCHRRRCCIAAASDAAPAPSATLCVAV